MWFLTYFKGNSGFWVQYYFWINFNFYPHTTFVYLNISNSKWFLKLRYNLHTMKFTFSKSTISVFSVVTRLYNHHHCLIAGYFLHHKKKPWMPWQSFYITPSLKPLATSHLLYGLAYSGYFMWIESYNISFWVCFFPVA